MRKKIIWVMGILFLLACQTLLPKESTPKGIPALLPTLESNLAAPIFPLASSTAQILSPTPTFTPPPTFTDSPTPTLAWIHQGPDAVTVPILLYHHVEIPEYEKSPYYVTPENFEEQMMLLRNWGYTTITLDLLLKSIKEGADLPARPLLITFDDGQLSVYTTAFPIMQKYGFTGIVYIVGSYMDAPSFMTAGQIKELAQAGWEVGSHSMKHRDLTTLDADRQKYEIFQSRKLLSEEVGVPVNSFAYPFGYVSEDIFTFVHNAGYTSAMGTGYSYNQGIWNIFMLQRRDVQGTYDLKRFASFLPWFGDPVFLPTDTPTPIPTPTRTPRSTRQP
jgi:peptidoglycan/xylan/chitin deacetylase (PgdA/CDA1 family)